MDINTIDEMEEKVKFAYAAGIFNGEGHVGWSMQPRKSGIDYPAIRISITQWHDPEILLAFQKIFGFGSVEHHTKDDYKWRYREQKPEHVFACIQKMWPWLSEPKRRDAKATIAAYEEYLDKKSAAMRFCRHGHDMSIYGFINSKGARQCRECSRLSNRRYKEKKRRDGLCSSS